MAYRRSPIAAYSGDDLESRSGDDRPDSVDLGDKPVYLLEHLATFTVSKETGIMYPADGMRKLLQLEKTTGIWSQKMQLCLDRSWVLIMDYETGNIIERFPASMIQDPTAFTSNDPMEMYNNILVFVVGSGAPHSRSEMHIFQCQSISAVHLVEDLKHLRDGKMITHQRDDAYHHHQPPPQQQQQQRHHPPPQRSGRPNRAEYVRGSGDRGDFHERDTDSELGALNDETSSTSSEKYERDVTVLNHCFDDIEKFIARLQHAAAASRELERRRKQRKSKKKDPGEGLLTLRTRPPHEKEFVDIFAKFKLSFNLLAKLKAHIHDPNAPELVHFLFTPLALIVDASHDSCYEPNLPARVVKPLLTRDAINLLVNCVTNKETELWRSLGDAWTVPRDQWKDGLVGAYHPVFYDGWSPEFPVVDELERSATPTNRGKQQQQQRYEMHEFDEEFEERRAPPPAASPGLRDFSASSEISVDSIERNGGAHAGPAAVAVVYRQPSPAQNNSTEAWLEELHAKGAKVVQVTYPRTANNDKELTVVRGEYLEILDDSRKWWKARNIRGQVAHVPHTIVQPIENGDGYNGSPYGAKNHKDANNDTSPGSADWVRNKHIASPTSDYGSNKANGNSPPPPPPMPPQASNNVSATNTISKRSNPAVMNGNGAAESDDYQRELKEVLTLFRERKRNLDIKVTPEVFIQPTSNPDEVQEWLKEKGFSVSVQKRLKGLTGNELFALKKETLEEYCGTEEGKRLASQITIQRSVSGYKTTRSSELMAILAKVRQKSESLSEDNHENQI